MATILDSTEAELKYKVNSMCLSIKKKREYRRREIELGETLQTVPSRPTSMIEAQGDLDGKSITIADA